MPKPLASDLDKAIGARLQKLRQQEGVSAAALAEAIGATQQQISRYENGQNKLAASLLYRFSVYLGVPISWFFQGCQDEKLKEAPIRHQIRELAPSYQQAQINEELETLQKLWPRLNRDQRAAVLGLLDTFL